MLSGGLFALPLSLHAVCERYLADGKRRPGLCGPAGRLSAQRHSGAAGGNALTYEELCRPMDPFVVVMIQCVSLRSPEAAFMRVY